jgi:uncharacterized protein YggL (DUF469 family)
MKKRLRKKLRLGEFREFGFEVSCRLDEDTPVDEIRRIDDDFIAMIEANGLQCGGGSSRGRWGAFVERSGRGTVTEEHRQIVARWLETYPLFTEYTISELVDAWYC